MNSRPGRLTGGGIRPLPDELRRRLVAQARERTGQNVRLRSARYRVVGYRNSAGAWVQRNPRNGHYFVRTPAGRRRTVKPDAEQISRSQMVSVELELDRGRGPRIYYTTLHGPIGI